MLTSEIGEVGREVGGDVATISYDYSQSKFSFTVKTIDLGSYLKVSTGIKKKKSPKKNFFGVRNFHV